MDHDHKSFWQTRKGSRAQHYGCWSRLGQIIGVIQQLRCKKIPGSIIAQFHCEPWTDRGQKGGFNSKRLRRFIQVRLHNGRSFLPPHGLIAVRLPRLGFLCKISCSQVQLSWDQRVSWDLTIPGLKWLDVSVNLPMAKWTCQFIDDFPNMVMFTCLASLSEFKIGKLRRKTM